MRALSLLLTLLALIVGCASTGVVQDDGASLPVPALTNSVERAAVNIGVLTTGKYLAYNNQHLYCPGADVDMWAMVQMEREAGITNITTLLAQQATWVNVKDAIRKATAGFGPEDLLVISFAGHGGRVEDYNNDEPGGYDSSLCMYDGPVLDDLVWAFICGDVPGCRIFMQTDCCYAAGNFRWYQRETPVLLVSRLASWPGTIVQFSAGRDNEPSLGSTTGGQWTSALDLTHPAPTLQKWFDWSSKECGDQTPTLVVYGPLAKSMLEGEPFR